MSEIERVNFRGVNCWKMENDQLAVWLSGDFGPRVLGLSFLGGENLLAELPHAKLPAGAGKEYSLMGGHRLWYAPEKPETTYIPDDLPPQVREVEDGLEFIQEIDEPTGIQKSWQIKLDSEDARMEIDHRLKNCGAAAFELAPWAVTMLRPGGVGLLPLQEEQEDDHGLWPNRQLVLWPYSDLRSRHLDIHNEGVFVAAELQEGALKIGAPNPAGYLAYRQKDQLFVKESNYFQGQNYVDRGASHQIYCSPKVIELETLGPLSMLQPGETINHLETWQVYSEGKWPEKIREIFDQTGF